MSDKVPIMGSEQIQKIRRAVGITQADLGRLLGVHGVTVAKWERGQLRPTAYQAGWLAACERAAQRQPEQMPAVRLLMQTASVYAVLALLLVWAGESRAGLEAMRGPRAPAPSPLASAYRGARGAA